MYGIDHGVLRSGLSGRLKGVLSVSGEPAGDTSGSRHGGSEPESRAWHSLKTWFFGARQRRSDYGSGYYVRSTAHPIVPETGLSFDESITALNSLDAVYDVKDTGRRGVTGLDQGA